MALKDEEVIAIRDQINRIRKEHYPNESAGGATIAEAYQIAALLKIASDVRGVDAAVTGGY